MGVSTRGMTYRTFRNTDKPVSDPRKLVTCRSEFVTADTASIGGVGINVAAEFAS
jgi:hypothetical protein